MAYDFKSVRVLVVESSPPLFQLIKGVLGLFGVSDMNVDSAFTVEEGFEKFIRKNHDLLIVDWMDTPDSGIRLVRKPFSAQMLAKRIEHIVEKPRPFVFYTDEDGKPGYVGPDRRTKQQPFEGEERRQSVDPKTQGTPPQKKTS